MNKCKFCHQPCDFKPGDLALHVFRDTYSKFPVSESHPRYIQVINTKCLFSYKENFPIVKGHDYICKLFNSKTNETFPVSFETLTKIEDPNTIMKDILTQKEP